MIIRHQDVRSKKHYTGCLITYSHQEWRWRRIWAFRENKCVNSKCLPTSGQHIASYLSSTHYLRNDLRTSERSGEEGNLPVPVAPSPQMRIHYLPPEVFVHRLKERTEHKVSIPTLVSVPQHQGRHDHKRLFLSTFQKLEQSFQQWEQGSPKSIRLSSSGMKKMKSEIQGVLLLLPRAYLQCKSNF